MIQIITNGGNLSFQSCGSGKKQIRSDPAAHAVCAASFLSFLRWIRRKTNGAAIVVQVKAAAPFMTNARKFVKTFSVCGRIP